MKKLLPLILALLTAPAFGQEQGYAAATYAENGKLLTLTNLQGLSDCPTKIAVGKVKKIKIKDNVAAFRLGSRDDNINIEVNLDRLAPREKRVVFLQMIRDRYLLRVAGYACEEGGAISAFSLYRQ
jgi:hypothetical protein